MKTVFTIKYKVANFAAEELNHLITTANGDTTAFDPDKDIIYCGPNCSDSGWILVVKCDATKVTPNDPGSKAYGGLMQ